MKVKFTVTVDVDEEEYIDHMDRPLTGEDLTERLKSDFNIGVIDFREDNITVELESD